MTATDIQTMGVKELKQLIKSAGLSDDGCIEKHELQERARAAAERLLATDDALAVWPADAQTWLRTTVAKGAAGVLEATLVSSAMLHEAFDQIVDRAPGDLLHISRADRLRRERDPRRLVILRLMRQILL